MVISALKTLKNKIESVSLTRFRSISKVLLFGILIRLLLAVYLSHDWDFQVWYVSFADIVAGLRSPYTAMNFSYPPIWAFTLTPFASLFSLLANSHDGLVRVSLGGPIIAATHPLFNLLVRLPLIASEVFIGLLIYDHVLKFKNENMAYKAFILWFLNPFVIFVSCVFGQFDVLVTLMVVLAFVFFLEKKYALCGLSIGLGALTKIYPIYLLPLYMIFTLKIDLKEKSKRLIIAKDTLQHCGLIFGGLLLSLFLIIPPLIISGSFYNFVQAVLRRTDYITSLGGISPTNAIYILGPDVFVWLNEPGRPQFIFSALSIVLWVSTLAVSLYYSFRSKLSSDHQRFLYIQTLTIVCLYLAALMVNPQYVIWIIPFLVLCYGIYGNYFKRIIILSVSALLFALFWIKP
ncbi:MAG: glycosyltransferase 87 family protein, partial [Promethearchaeota archaeon]